MKKTLAIFCLFVSLSFSASSITAPVFDLSNWLTAIDQMYSSYDMVMNTMKQIEQQYQSYQHLIQEAQSWDLSNIQWDGDIDFRDEIKDVTKTVNKQLSTLREIEEIFTVEQYTMAGMSFTVQDLVGLGDSGKDISAIIKNAGKYTQDSFSKAADSLVNNLSAEEKKAIWRKYGLSPKNFVYLQQKKALVNDVKEKIFAKATEKGKELQATANLEGANQIVALALAEGEHTQKELLQQQLLLINELIKNISTLGSKIDDTAAFIAYKQTVEEELLQQEQEAIQNQILETKRSKSDSMF